MRALIYDEVLKINPVDPLEARHQQEVLAWIESGADLFRIAKPAVPPQHLVSYFVVTDGEYLLLVEHKNAGLWLPTGGHVEPDEHPRDTVVREAVEELGVYPEFVFNEPLFITVTETVGATAGHTDVSLWYVLRGDREEDIKFDRDEFHSIHWFSPDQIPYLQSDPHMKRFVEKLNRVVKLVSSS